MRKGRERRKGEGSIYLRGDKYWVKYYYDGKPNYEYTGKREDCGPAVYKGEKNAETRAWTYMVNVQKKVSSAELGHSTFQAAKVTKLRMTELFDSLEAERRAKEARAIDARAHNASWFSDLKRAREWFGDLVAVKLNTDFWNKWTQKEGAKLLEEYAPATVNRKLERVREAFNLAVDRDVLAKVPGHVRLYSERDNIREGFFEQNEFQALLDQTDNEDYRDFYTFGYLIGWRRNAVSKLAWSSVDIREGTITLPWKLDKVKIGNKLPIGKKGTPLHDLIMRRWDRRTFNRDDGTTAISTYVFHFHGEPITARKAWATACRKATELFIESKGRQGAMLMKQDRDHKGKPLVAADGTSLMVPARTFHDFRRTAYRNMRKVGIDKDVARTIVGHETDAMARRYGIVVLDEKEEALSRLSL